MNTKLFKARGRVMLSLPNLLTYGRILTVPLVVACLYWHQLLWMRWVALGLFIAAAITDYFDGYLARIWGEQSAWGRMLDPIADKLLVAACLFMLGTIGTIQSFSLWAALIILSREILVSGLREFLAGLSVSVPVSALAKWKTALQLISLAFLIADSAGDSVLPIGWTHSIGIALLWIAALITIFTGWDYLKAGIHHIVSEPQ